MDEYEIRYSNGTDDICRSKMCWTAYLHDSHSLLSAAFSEDQLEDC